MDYNKERIDKASENEKLYGTDPDDIMLLDDDEFESAYDIKREDLYNDLLLKGFEIEKKIKSIQKEIAWNEKLIQTSKVPHMIQEYKEDIRDKNYEISLLQQQLKKLQEQLERIDNYTNNGQSR